MPPSSPSGIEPTTLRLKDFVIDDDVAGPWDTDNFDSRCFDHVKLDTYRGEQKAEGAI